MEAFLRRISREAAVTARAVADGPWTAKRIDQAALRGRRPGPPTTCSISPDVNDPGKRNVTYDQLVAAYTESTHALIEGAPTSSSSKPSSITLNAKAAAFAVDLVFEAAGPACR